MSSRRMCDHCGKRFVCRPRGLCWPCYHDPGVRFVYGIAHRSFRVGDGTHNNDVPAPWATYATPGSAEKQAVLAWRAAAGVALFHPDDKSFLPS